MDIPNHCWKNKNETTDRMLPKNYSSWLGFWEQKSGKIASKCSACGSNKIENIIGAHVYNSSYNNSTEYIVPLCKSCNKKQGELVIPNTTIIKAN